MKQGLWLLLLMICSTHASAQFSDSTHYHLRYTAAGIINKANNANSFVLKNFLGFSVSKKKITLNTSNNWIYGLQDGRLSNNDFSSFFNFDYLKSERKLYYWGIASYTTSFSLNIHRQWQTGAGIGYNILNGKNAELVISDGLLFESASLVNVDGADEKYETLRNSLRIKQRWLIAERITIEGLHFWQPSLERRSDYIFRTDLSVGVKLKKWLSLSSVVTYNKVSYTGRENLLINFGLTAEHFF